MTFALRHQKRKAYFCNLLQRYGATFENMMRGEDRSSFTGQNVSFQKGPFLRQNHAFPTPTRIIGPLLPVTFNSIYYLII